MPSDTDFFFIIIFFFTGEKSVSNVNLVCLAVSQVVKQ